jgi:hypothetical protein
MTVVQGNPAVPVAKCGVPLVPGVSIKEFSKGLQPSASVGTDLRSKRAAKVVTSETANVDK